jgi:hypothetical protein
MLLCVTVAAGPMIVDVLLDWWSAPQAGTRTANQTKASVKFYFMERIVIICALALPSLVYYFGQPLPELQFANIMISTIIAQRIFVLAPVLSFLSHTDPTHFPVSFRVIAVVANAGLNILTPYWAPKVTE